MPPRASIIIPCRDGAAWLGEAIESCLGQSWPNLQIVVVDNGSTDGSLDLAKRYEARGITVLTCERAGASAARNAGLKHADGDLIQFLDADDILDADKIRRQVERLNAAPAASVAARFCAGGFFDRVVARRRHDAEFCLAHAARGDRARRAVE
jgi:glycosyltransferase involved in cell wall biosynthesis